VDEEADKAEEGAPAEEDVVAEVGGCINRGGGGRGGGGGGGGVLNLQEIRGELQCCINTAVLDNLLACLVT
jgi:hypothetical protein